MFRTHWKALAVASALLAGLGILWLVRLTPHKPVVEPPALQTVRNSNAPAILVEIAYPGASAQTVNDTVAVPIEQQLHGTEGMLLMSSRCTNDGGYSLRAEFANDVDVREALKRIQERVDLAMPQLPDAVQKQGLTVRMGPASMLMFVGLSSSDNRFDLTYLSSYTKIAIQDVFKRTAGVADSVLLGRSSEGFRVHFDPARLAACGITIAEAAEALEQQNLQIEKPKKGSPPAAGAKEAGFTTTIKVQGRLLDAHILENIILKVSQKGLVYVKDVGRVEAALPELGCYAVFDGTPIAVSGVFLLPSASAGETRQGIMEKLRELAGKVPAGIDLNVVMDFTRSLESPGDPGNAEFLRLDLVLPDSLKERAESTTLACAKMVREVASVQHVLTLVGEPYTLAGNEACLLIQLSPRSERTASAEDIMQDIWQRLQKQPLAATAHLSDLAGTTDYPTPVYPIDLWLVGSDFQQTRQLAELLEKRWKETDGLRDVWPRMEDDVPMLFVDIDRKKAAELGVALTEISNELDHFYASARPGSTPATRHGLEKLQVRNQEGKLISLTKLAEVRETSGPPALVRRDGQPAVRITARLAPGSDIEKVREFCEQSAAKLLPNGYSLRWRRD